MRKIYAFVLVIILLLLATNALAATSSYGIDAAIDYVQRFTTGSGSGSSGAMMDKLLRFARNLFVSLATLSLALGLIRMILSGESNIGTFAALIAKWILYVGVFIWIMSNNIPKVIVNSFVIMGSNIGGTGSIAPDNILSAGIRMYGTLVQRGWEAGWGDFLGVTLLGLIVLVVIAMIAGLFALALIEMHLVICGGAVLLGFSGFDFTRDIAVSYLKYAVSVGIKLMMIMIIYGLANSLIPSWETSFKSATDMSTLITSAGQILGGVIAIFMAAKYIPNTAQAIVNRASVTLGQPVYVTNAPAYAMRSPSTITSSGGLVRTIMDAFRGNRAAPSAMTATPVPSTSMATAMSSSSSSSLSSMSTPAANPLGQVSAVRNGGVEGMITGSGYTPLGSMQAARHVQNPANAASMENYIGASILRNEFANLSGGAGAGAAVGQSAGFMTSPARPGVSTSSAGRPARVKRANEIVQDLKNQRIMNQFIQSQNQSQSRR
ncbi:MAG: type IV secretion system protein [Synergistaceae bacterium]|nr:type IV secretion system protein [Synergistaceae bacterium]